jgi:uncharacterized protein (TIGR03000 family)
LWVIESITGRLLFDGKEINGTGTKRAYKSPALVAGKPVKHRVEAVWVEKGVRETRETNVEFKAGEDVSIKFGR